MSRRKIQSNLVDRFISYVDPIRGARRLRARAAMALVGGYIGARRDRPATKTWRPTQNSPDADLLPDLPELRERSRDLVRNSPLATGALGTVLMNVVGTGLTLVPRPDGEVLGLSEEQTNQWVALVEREFRLWSETSECDLTHTQNFFQMQELVFRGVLESGDIFVLLPMKSSKTSPYELRLQVIEADRIETPRGMREEGKTKAGLKIAGGVEMDGNGVAVAYHILQAHPGSLEGRGRGKSDRVMAIGDRTGRRNVVHVFERARPGQTRGIPYLAPVIEPLKQLDKYTEAELMATVISALLTVFVKTEDAAGLAPLPAGEKGGTSTTADNEEIKLGSGSIVDLRPGEDVETVSMNRPNTAFDPFVQAVLRQVGVALGLPFEVLVKHFTASFSAARAALLEAWRFFRSRRAFLATSFCMPIYEVWMREAIASGRIQAPGFFEDPAMRCAYLQAEWIGDSPGAIDPTKEVTAAEKRLEIGVSTLAEETLALTGGLWEDKHRQQVKERRLRQQDGLLSSSVPSRPPPPAEEQPSGLEKPENE